MLTFEILKKICPLTPDATIKNFIDPLNAGLALNGITTKLRVCHFLAQILEESQYLTRLSENLNYNAKGLLNTFHTHFTPDEVANFEHKPELIANRVYSNRNGNGDEKSGDGWKYRGRGFLMTTFESNYSALSKSMNIDFVKNPDLLSTPKYAIDSALYFWTSHKLNAYADSDDIKHITNIINGGTNGLDIRTALLEHCKTIIT